MSQREGIVLKGVGGFYTVRGADGSLTVCKARGKFRLQKVTPLAGDAVRFSVSQEDGAGRLEEILPRKNVFVRPPLANLDMLLIVVSKAPPETDLFLIDRITAQALTNGIQPVICVNKCDVDRGELFMAVYEKVGFPVFSVSAATGNGLNCLLEFIAGKVVALTGNSGVGKSSLLNAMNPSWDLPVGGISPKLGRGRHTTRHVELLLLPSGGMVADTPGFSSFELISEGELVFPEIQNRQCLYNNCLHVGVKGCAVLEAVEAGEIPQSRYESYCRLLEIQAKK